MIVYRITYSNTTIQYGTPLYTYLYKCISAVCIHSFRVASAQDGYANWEKNWSDEKKARHCSEPCSMVELAVANRRAEGGL